MVMRDPSCLNIVLVVSVKFCPLFLLRSYVWYGNFLAFDDFGCFCSIYLYFIRVNLSYLFSVSPFGSFRPPFDR